MFKKIVFLTFHNWESKRQGGFHKLAEYCCRQGNDILFVGYPRPVCFLLRKAEYFNFKTVFSLYKGIQYKEGNGTLFNKNLMSFDIPLPHRMWQYFHGKLLNFFTGMTIPTFNRFAERNFKNADIFVFESTECVLLYPKIKKRFPSAKIVYRPSDPLIASKIGKRFMENEVQLLKEADTVFLVNHDAVELYSKYISDFELTVNYQILPNGVDINAYLQSYAKPEQLNLPNTALYVGARPIDWNMIMTAAKLVPEVNFIIVCPVQAPMGFTQEANSLKNLHYINGIDKKMVPQWVTNADLIIVPNPQNMYKDNVWGITAKYYQAMVANKPIIAYHDSERLVNHGIKVTYTVEDFVNEVRKSMGLSINYQFDVRDWKDICKTFYDEINK